MDYLFACRLRFVLLLLSGDARTMIDTPPKIQEVTTNEDHLNLLSILYCIFGLIQIVVAALLLLWAVLGCVLLAQPIKGISTAMFGSTNTPLFALGCAVSLGLLFLIFLGVLGAAHVYSGLYIKRRKKRFFSLVLAGFDCLLIPIGTVLGVSALIILNRASVKRIYEV